MSIMNGYSLDGNYRPYWGEWDSEAVENLEAILPRLGCLEPRFYRAPSGNISNQLKPGGYLSYVLQLVPGSLILGYMHKPQVFTNKAKLTVIDSSGAGFLFTAIASSGNGNLVSVNIPNPPASQALSIAVAGNAITINLASDGNGFITSTLSDVQTAFQASAAAAALATCTILGGTATAVSPTTQQSLQLAGGSNLTDVANFVNYNFSVMDESLQIPFSSAPIRDDFVNGQPSLFEEPYPVVGSGNFHVEFWNTSPSFYCAVQLIFIVLEPQPSDLLRGVIAKK